MQIIDSHCHINFEELQQDFPGLLERAKENQISHMLCVAVNLEDFPEVIGIARSNENIFASVGVHPCYTDCADPSVEQLLSLADDENIVAIGETGLDYFRVKGDAASSELDWQRERFVRHIDAARQCGKPLIIHTRNAADDTMAMLKSHEAGDAGGVMHCFAEDWQTAEKALDIGFYISFSGIVTFKSAESLREVARKVPSDRILVETDSPYLAPVPFRGKTNEPSYVRHTAEFVADLRGVSLESLAETTTTNFFQLFSTAKAA
ncbi:MAG: TatD family hydrolase [Acidiferrobacterales bacterium]|nr:TatD family hydrolase [Acidiferrobacterales bacterium]